MTPARKKAQTLHDTCDDMIRVKELLWGNGHEGMLAKVERHDRTLWEMKGVQTYLGPFLGAVGTIVGLVAIFLK
jgi:hypothetical protein